MFENLHSSKVGNAFYANLQAAQKKATKVGELGTSFFNFQMKKKKIQMFLIIPLPLSFSVLSC